MPIRKSWRVHGNEHLAPVHINLDGPEGNAWHLMVHMCRRAGLLGYTKKETEEVRTRMMEKDYVNLIAVMEKEFPGAFEFCTENERLMKALLKAGVEDAYADVRK